jgi:hypothetical protein
LRLDNHEPGSPGGAQELPPAYLLIPSGHGSSSGVGGMVHIALPHSQPEWKFALPHGLKDSVDPLAGEVAGLCPEVRAALPALKSPASVESMALRTGQVHGAGKKLSDDGAETQNARHQGDVQQRLAHGPSLSQGSPRRADGFHV